MIKYWAAGSMGVRIIVQDKIKTAEYENNPQSRHNLAQAVYDTISSAYHQTSA